MFRAKRYIFALSKRLQSRHDYLFLSRCKHFGTVGTAAFLQKRNGNVKRICNGIWQWIFPYNCLCSNVLLIRKTINGIKKSNKRKYAKVARDDYIVKGNTMKKDITYNYFQRFVKDKDTAVKHILQSTLQKTAAMFVYTDTPRTLPPFEIEKLLQKQGGVLITEIDGGLYALSGNLGGEVDAYNRPTAYTVANPALDITKTFDIQNDKDGVYMQNDAYCSGLIDTIGKNAVLMTDAQISLNAAAVLTRLTLIMSASDDKTKKSCEQYLSKMLDGDFAIIGENAFLNGVRLQTANNDRNNINSLIELMQYYKAQMLNEMGLNAAFNMKRERLTANEVLLQNDELLPLIDNMLQCRRDGIRRVNEKYGTQISVDLNTVWKTEKENNDKAMEMTETATETDTENDTENDTETQKIVDIIREMRESETDTENEKTGENGN